MRESMAEKVYIVRIGESALKGKNKPYFERMLQQRIRKSLRSLAEVRVERRDGLLFLRLPGGTGEEEVLERVSRIFGVDSISPALELDTADLDGEAVLALLARQAVAWAGAAVEERQVATFKIVAKRADKRFPIPSPDLASRLGAAVLKSGVKLRVDVHKPDLALHVEVRAGKAYLFDRKVPGQGGMPLGTNGKGMVLLSGGIDSPVAAYMMAHRGMKIEGVHFHSYPYTSERALEKVLDLGRILAVYCDAFPIHSFNLLPVQEQILERCPPEQLTLLVRRFMVKVADRMAQERGDDVLITGESLGQVASQTAESIVVTGAASCRPIFRPLIGMDKVDIVDAARKIGTYETSILPFEDCCTVFLPKHPLTRPDLEQILASEALLDQAELLDQVLASRETFRVDAGEEGGA